MEEEKYRRQNSPEISPIGIALIIIALIGIALILWGVFIWFTYGKSYSLNLIFAIPLWIIGGIFFLIGVGLRVKRKKYTKKEEKQDYMNLDWLKHQHYVLGRSFRDIAEDQNVSMIRIKKWIDKLENSSRVN